MDPHRALSVSAATVTALALLGAPARATECSADWELPHMLRWTDQGLMAVADTRGQLVRLSAAGSFEVLGRTGFYRRHVDVTHDGVRAVSLVEDFSNQERAAACAATFVDLMTADSRTGGDRRLLRVDAFGAMGLRVSPSGRWALALLDEPAPSPSVILVDAADVQPEPGPPMGVEVVDLASGRIRHWGDDPRSRLRRRARGGRGVR